MNELLVNCNLGLYAYNTLTGNEIESYVIQYEWNETKRIGSQEIGCLLSGDMALKCQKYSPLGNREYKVKSHIKAIRNGYRELERSRSKTNCRK